MTRTSSSSAGRAAQRRSVRHLVATSAVAALAIAGAALTPQSTGALYTATATSTLGGFEVQSLCLFDTYTSVPDRLAELGPSVHWGFDPADDEGWTAGGDPLPVAVPPDATLLCDDGVVELAAGQSVSSDAPLGSPTTTVLVLGTPSAPGTVLSFLAADGGADVVVDGLDVAVRAWADDGVPVTVATGALDDGLVHVLAVTVNGTDVTLWADGGSTAVSLPAALTGALGGAGFGLGTLASLDPSDAVATAGFTATELAVVGGTLTDAQLEALHAAAVPAA